MKKDLQQNITTIKINVMENKNQIEILASTSLESQSYEQAYKYYSQLLEKELKNKNI